MSTHAVIFDRDNTLVRSDQTAIEALNTRIATIAPTLPSGVAAAHWAAWPGPWPRSEREEPDFWCAFWSTLAARYNLSGDITLALQQVGAFYHTCFVAFPDAARCLSALRSRGLRLAVLTNFELPSIHLTLQHAGLDPRWFTALLSSSACGAPKPNPHAYRAAAAALGVAPGDCLFVDDLVVNVEAACAVGMRGVLLDRRCASGPPSSIECVHDLDGIVDLVAPAERSL